MEVKVRQSRDKFGALGKKCTHPSRSVTPDVRAGLVGKPEKIGPVFTNFQNHSYESQAAA
jgi:hypothetical protein